MWLMQWDFPTFRWVETLLRDKAPLQQALEFLGHHAALLALPIGLAAFQLWTYRTRPVAPVGKVDAALVQIVALVLVVTAPLLAITIGFNLHPDWGNPLFVLAPVALLAALPRLAVRRRAVARTAITAALFTAILLVGSPVYSVVNYWARPLDAAHAPHSELATALTTLWRERFGSPLPIVVSGYRLAAHVVFYSPDHPKMYADFEPPLSPWIDFPAELRQKGFTGVCDARDRACQASVDALNPQAERTMITVTRSFAGITGPTMRFVVRLSPPRR
jgi:hypothetical protein